MKYLVIRRNDREEMISWSNAEITHADMAEVFIKLPIISAGFVTFRNGSIACEGRSESLNKNSRPRDTALLMASLKATTAVRGD